MAAIDPDLADTAAFCAAYEVPLDVSANCVVVAGRRGDVSTMAACMVLATDRADVNKTVRKQLDVRKISFASMADAVSPDRDGVRRDHADRAAGRLADPGRRGRGEPQWVVIGSGIRGSKILLPGTTLAGCRTARCLISHCRLGCDESGDESLSSRRAPGSVVNAQLGPGVGQLDEGPAGSHPERAAVVEFERERLGHPPYARCRSHTGRG